MRNTKTTLLTALLFVLTGLIGCGSGDSDKNKPEGTAEEAVAAVKQMNEYAKKKEWDLLMSEYYSNTPPFESPEAAQAMLGRYTDGDLGPQMAQKLSRAINIKPEVKDGKAVFQEGGETVLTLYLDESTKQWKYRIE